MKAGDIMTGRVVSISPDAGVLEAIELMMKNHISGLPVIDSSGALVGMVTEGDFLRRAETGTTRKRPRWLEFLVGPNRLAEEYVESHARKVGEVMTREPITITEDTPLADHLQEQLGLQKLDVQWVSSWAEHPRRRRYSRAFLLCFKGTNLKLSKLHLGLET